MNRWKSQVEELDHQELQRNNCYTKPHSKIEQGDQEASDVGVLLVRRSRADAGNEAI